MATETFDKTIYIDDKAADRIIETLKKKPAQKKTSTQKAAVDEIFERSEDALKWLLSNSKTSSAPLKK